MVLLPAFAARFLAIWRRCSLASLLLVAGIVLAAQASAQATEHPGAAQFCPDAEVVSVDRLNAVSTEVAEGAAGSGGVGPVARHVRALRAQLANAASEYFVASSRLLGHPKKPASLETAEARVHVAQLRTDLRNIVARNMDNPLAADV
jgi:hypothetical protein